MEFGRLAVEPTAYLLVRSEMKSYSARGRYDRPMACRRSAIVVAVFMAACSSPTAPNDRPVDFIVDAAGERFVLRLSDPGEIRLADDRRLGRNQRFPSGTLRRGDGGFNSPWTWHLDPATTRMVEVAVEVCDGRPSYVEEHFPDGSPYCPWSARVLARK